MSFFDTFDTFGLRIKLNTGDFANSISVYNEQTSNILYNIFNNINAEYEVNTSLDFYGLIIDFGNYSIGIDKFGENKDLYHIFYVVY
jgi:hypothetical protein